MGIYDFNGKRVDRKPVFVGAIMGTNTDENRFLAMKQLLDIGMKRFTDPNCEIAASEFTLASAGAVCLLPEINTALYESHPIDFLWTKNEDTQYKPASVTKALTVITGLPYVTNLADTVTIQEDDVIGGSGNYFSAGDVLTVQDLIYAMMLPSSNTTGSAYARYVGKKLLADDTATLQQSLTAFYAAMAQKSAGIGLENSVWTSVIGGRDTTLTTAADIVRIGVAACSHNALARIWNKKEYTINIRGTNPRQQLIETTVTNETLEADYYIYGGKTGQSENNRALLIVAEPKNY